MNWYILLTLMPFMFYAFATYMWLTKRWFYYPDGFCIRCKYNLNGTPEKCPECGLVVGRPMDCPVE